YAHREKLRLVGLEDRLEPLNREALAIAAAVARDTGALLAGDICNTNVYDPDERESEREVRGMFEEQVGWAADAGAEFVIAETYSYAQEALLGLEAIKAAGLPAVVTLALHRRAVTREGWSPAEACRRLADAGADVVGLNCIRGPRTMLPELAAIVEAVHVPVAALPVPYRTTEAEPTFQALADPDCDCIPGGHPFPTALDPFVCNRYEIGEFARAAYDLGVRYLGVCCGNGAHHTRAMAEALGRKPPASRYSPDMSKHAYFGTDETLRPENLAFARDL
ncbi:MAG: homocysteine S-methyltransferase family protein, partial [Thermoleophilia bacterium]|nr:homocysteine S-methyltransferase family protein [Thermoleophilia bacterium]